MSSKLAVLPFLSLSMFACSQQNPAITTALSNNHVLQDDQIKDEEIGSKKNSDESAVAPESLLTPSAALPGASAPAASPTPTSDLPEDNEVIPATKPTLLADKLALAATPAPDASKDTVELAFKCDKVPKHDACFPLRGCTTGDCQHCSGPSYPNCDQTIRFFSSFGEPPAAKFNEPQSVLFELVLTDECSNSRPRVDCENIPPWLCNTDVGPTLTVGEQKTSGKIEWSLLKDLFWDGSPPQTPLLPLNTITMTKLGKVANRYEHRFIYGQDTVQFSVGMQTPDSYKKYLRELSSYYAILI